MINRFNKNIDTKYFYLTMILMGIGFIIQYSASSALGAAKFKDPGFYMKGHLIRIIIGACCGSLFLFFDHQKLKKIAPMLILTSIILLIITLIYNKIFNRYPAARWLPLFVMNFQTAEFAKLALIIYLAAFIDKRQKKVGNLTETFLPAATVISAIVVLVVIEPDFSFGAVIALISITVMWIGGIKFTHLISFVLSFILFSSLIILSSPYKRERVATFFSNGGDVQNAGYQITQSLITLGNGGFWGRGLGGSIEKNLFLPDPHTDFVFSVTGEEFGFIGAFALLVLFLLIFLRGIQISLKSHDVFTKLLGVGISISIFLNVLFNIGVVCNIFPVTGLPLPFLSYGGSAMIYNFACVGIILNISKKSNLSTKGIF